MSTHDSTELITDVGEMHELQGELDALFGAVNAPATARFSAMSTWLAHVPLARPWIVLVRRSNAVVGAALLARIDVGVGHVIMSMGEHHLPGRLPALDGEAASSLAAALVAQLGGLRRPWRLDLHSMDGADPVIDAIHTHLDRSTVSVVAQSPRLEFAADVSINSYLSRNTRSARAKAVNRIDKAGLDLQLRWTRDLADVERELLAVIELCRDRDRQSGHNRILERARSRTMFADSIRAHAAAGRVRLLTLKLNTQLAAFALCLDGNGLLYVHSNRAAPAWLNFSPGVIVNAEVVEAAYADPALHGVDWGGSPQRFKMSGGAVLHEYITLHAWSGPLSHRVFTAGQSGRIVAGRIARRFPKPS